MVSGSILSIVLLIFGASAKSVVEFRDVETEYGVVRGYVGEGEYFAYLGIPYAAPPVGTHRFKAPLPPNKWNGTYEATRTVKCPKNGEGDEDCLIVNIFTPLKPVKDIPVLVYIHGGSFIIGSGQTTGVDALIKNDIIVVTINYRLGALGFLCLGIEDAPGNAGMKDQVAALKWVQDNISGFGGDPSKVTIYGMSAGGASVELLVLSKVTEGMFRYAIVESAAATPVWVVDPTPVETAYNALNVSKNNNLEDLVNYYRDISHEKLSKVNNDYYRSLLDGTFGFVPCIERNLTTNTAFLTESPYEILTRGNFYKIPIMFLFTTSEGLNLRSAQYYELDYKNKIEENFASFLPADLIFDSEVIKRETAKEVKCFYFGDKNVGDDTLVEYLDYFGDSLILHGLLNSVQFHAKNGNPVYLMEFSYKGKLGNYDKFYDNITLAGHGDIVKYAILNKAVEDESDAIAVKRVSKLISNFVKSGNPNPDPSPLLPFTWPVVEEDKTSYLLFGKDMKILENPYWERKQFWDLLYSKLRRPFLPYRE